VAGLLLVAAVAPAWPPDEELEVGRGGGAEGEAPVMALVGIAGALVVVGDATELANWVPAPEGSLLGL